MSQTETRIPLADALQVADMVGADLSPGCVRIGLVGSCRRKAKDIADIDFLAIPRMATPSDESYSGGRLFPSDEPVSALDIAIRHLVQIGQLQRLKGFNRDGCKPWKMATFRLTGRKVNLELYLADESNWGMQMVIRTGPAEFNKRMVTEKRKGGLLPGHLRIKNGFRLYDSAGKEIPTPAEIDVFRLYGLPFQEPWERK